MWKVLKNEFLYHKTLICGATFFYLVVATFFIFNSYTEPVDSVHAFRRVLILPLSIIWVQRLLDFKKRNRDRSLRLLPLTPLAAGVERILFLVIIWIGFLAIYCSAHLLAASILLPYKLVPNVIILTGSFLLANSITFLLQDHFYLKFNKAVKKLLSIVFYSILVSGYVLFIMLGAMATEFGPFLGFSAEIIRKVYFSINGSLLILSAGIILSVIDIVMYCKRTAYTK